MASTKKSAVRVVCKSYAGTSFLKRGSEQQQQRVAKAYAELKSGRTIKQVARTSKMSEQQLRRIFTVSA